MRDALLLFAGSIAIIASAGSARGDGTLIVKYSEAVDACAESTFSDGRSFASVAPGDSLDGLNAELEVTEIRSLFMKRPHLDARQAKAKWRERMERAVRRHPRRAARAARAGRLLPDPLPDLSRVYRLRYSADLPAEEAAARYAADPLVEYAQPEYEVSLQYTPDDPYFSSAGTWTQSYDDLWNLKLIGAAIAWDSTMGEGSVIAIVDSGIDPDHPDIEDNLWTNPGEIAGNGLDDDGNGYVDDIWGWDFIQDDPDPRDTSGHGTHVAGVAAAVGDNATGILGVAPRAKVMAVRALTDGDETGDVLGAILYAAENGADVINNSWGTRAFPGGPLDDVVETALALGSVVVFAGGNGGLTLSSVPWWRHPDAINVAMTRPPNGTSAFSATDADLAAPGSYVLSLRSSPGRLGSGIPVGDDYAVYSGTSAAAPHVAGAAALLCSVFPSLTPREIEWHLEAAAIQPGDRGWEGTPWNPSWGWGHLDLSGIFDPVPVTTRLDRHGMLEQHRYVGEINEAGSVAHEFTTLDPIAWSVSAPAWLSTSAGAGVGPGSVDLVMDATGIVPGVHDASYALSAPGSNDGGATLPVRLYAYPDLGLAPGVEIKEFTQGVDGISSTVTGPVMAGSPTHSVIAWNSNSQLETWSAVVTPDGGVNGPFMLNSGMYGQQIDIGFDGRHFAVLWFDWDRKRDHLLLTRLGVDGTPIDTTPREIWRPSARWWTTPQIAFDGRRYIILWTQVSGTSRRPSKLLMLRMGSDFAIEKSRRVIHKGDIGGGTANAGSVRIACGTGHCLAVWRDRLYSGGGNKVVGLLLVDGEPQDQPFDILPEGGLYEPQVVSDGTDYLVIVSSESVLPCGPTWGSWCEKKIFGVRVSGSGQVLDASPIELFSAPGDSPFGITLGRAGFDGEAYLIPYALRGNCSLPECPSVALASRVATDGTPLDTGGARGAMLVDSGPFITKLAVVESERGATIAWSRRERDPLSGRVNRITVEARPFDLGSSSPLPPLSIGSIGSVSLGEEERWGARLVAPGLDPAKVTFSAENLPPGAMLAATSGVIHWRPSASEAGTYAGVRLIADDGSQQIEETISFVVANLRSSITGTLRQSGGTPIAGAIVRLQGARPSRETITSTDGTFAFFDLEPRVYRLKLGPPTRKSWSLGALRFELTGATEDLSGLDLVATPR